MPKDKTIFRTPETERQYFELFETVLAKWNVPK